MKPPQLSRGYFLSLSSHWSEISASVSDVPAPHSSSPQEPRVLLPTLAEKVNRRQVQVYVLPAQLFTFTENVLPELSFVTVGFLTRLHIIHRFKFFFCLLGFIVCNLALWAAVMKILRPRETHFCPLNVLNFNSIRRPVAPKLSSPVKA